MSSSADVIPLVNSVNRIKSHLVDDINKIHNITVHIPPKRNFKEDKSSTLLFLNHTDSFLSTMATNYNTNSDWDYYELSNGGFYISPKTPDFLHIDTINFVGQVSKDGIGIVVSMLAYRMLSRTIDQEIMQKNYDLLRQYAVQHVGVGKVLKLL